MVLSTSKDILLFQFYFTRLRINEGISEKVVGARQTVFNCVDLIEFNSIGIWFTECVKTDGLTRLLMKAVFEKCIKFSDQKRI